VRLLQRLVALVERFTDSSLIWYALLLGLVAVGVVLALIVLGPVTSQIFEDNYCLQCT
jgi:hypothetical protein